METWFSRIIKKMVLKTYTTVGVIFVFALFMCFVTKPNWLKKQGAGIVEKVTKGYVSSHLKSGSIQFDVFFIKIEGDYYEYYSLETKKIERLGINNLIGRRIDFKYDEVDGQGSIDELFVDNQRIYPEEYESTKTFFSFFFIALLAGVWSIWGFVVVYKKTGEI